MTGRSQTMTNSFSRVWLQEGGPGPARPIEYFGNWMAGAATWDQGELTTIREPDPDNYNKFIRTGRFRGEPGDPELSITARYTFQRSRLLKAARADCAHGLQVHMGQCADPQDLHRGWEKALIVEEAAITSWGTEALGAMSPGDTAPINEEVPFTGTDLYEVPRLNFAELGQTLTTREVTSVFVCDSQQCGACGVASDGCQIVVALEGGIAASPGQSPTVLYTSDGGATWGEAPITTMAANEAGSVIFCVGSNVFVLSADSESLHYTDLPNLLLGTYSWTEVTTGFVTAKGPLAAHSNGSSSNWIVGEGGYIYFSDNLTSGVEVSNAGSATTSDLNAVHFSDALNGVAVGAANAVVYTSNGGVSWSSVTGPAVGVVLNTVWARSPQEWIVGTASGRLFYTVNGGGTWTETSFSGSSAGQVRDIKFVTPSVGYMAHSTAAGATIAGRVFRTIDGGRSWYLLPEGTGSIPTNDYISRLAVCDDPNIVYGVGLAGNAVDGIIVKAA